MYHGPVAKAVADRLKRKAYARALLWDLQFAVKHGNTVYATAREIAATTGFDEHTVGKALADLEHAFAVRRPRLGLIELNPYLVWSGSDNQREQEQLRWSGEMAALAPDLKALARDVSGKVVQLEAVQ